MNAARHEYHRNNIAILLALMLLLAQWSGMAHRIEHAPFAQINSAWFADEHDSDSKHSCVAFDAAAVADAMYLPPCVAPVLTGTRVRALWAAFLSWEASLALHFSSRAPPIA